jgi:myo-inositol-1(or 4)-monophosphatase
MSAGGFRPVLEPLLRAAGELAMGYFRRVVAEAKADGSAVTRADREVEDLLVSGLSRLFPDCAVRSEEGGGAEGTAGTWHVDPIDGTSSFVEGLAHWGPTVCLVRGGELVVGAFWQPRLDEFWFAEKGGGSWRGATRLVAREPVAPEREQALCAPSRFHRVGPVPWPGKVRALGSSAAHLALVASGAAAAAVVPTWSLWDVGCGALLLEEAGYPVLDARGEPVSVARCPPGLPLVTGAPNAVRHLFRDGWAERVLSRARHVNGGQPSDSSKRPDTAR